MKYVIYILLFVCICQLAIGQSNPSGFPTQSSTGWFRHGWDQSDSGKIFTNRAPTFTPRFPGTVEFYQDAGVDSLLSLWTGARWLKLIPGFDSTSLSNRINLKLNITDTTNKWWGIGKRWVDTVYRKNDSTIGFTINNGTEQTFQILGRSSGGGGGTGTVTSVGLSLPSAFSVTPSTITTSGIFNVTMPGLSAQYVRGNGTVATTDTGMIPNFYLKVRSLFSGTSPITYNSGTGAIGIPDANNTGQKGAATFNNSDFIDNGAGLISLRSPSGGAGVDSIFRTPGIDSIYFTINSVQYSILDSLGAIITADNGLTKTGNNIQWGGTLLHDATVDGVATYISTFTSSGGLTARALNTGSGNGFYASAVSGTALTAQSTSGKGILASSSTQFGITTSSTSNIGLYSSTTSGVSAGAFETNPSTTNTIATILQLKRYSSGTAANGIGGAIEFITEPSTGTADVTTGYIISKLTDATFATRTSSMEFWNANSATVARKAAISGNGQWTWDGYPALTAQADTATYKPIAIDGSGNVVKMTGWAGSGGGGGGGSPSLTYKYIGFGGIGNVLSPGEAAFQYDSTKNKLTVDSADLVQVRGDSVFLRRTSPALSPDSLFADGNSIMVGLNASPITDSAHAYLLANRLGVTINNIAVSGTGMVSIANRFLINKNPDNTVMTIIMGGLNDGRRNGAARKTLNKIINGYKAIFGNQYMKSFTNAGTGGVNVTRYGSWTNSWDAQAEGGKTNVGAYTSTTNDSIVYVFTDSTVIVGLMGGDGSAASYIGTDIDVYIDGVYVTTINTNNQTDGVADGSGLDNKRCAMAFYFGGLSFASHSIKLVKKSTGGGGFMIMDYFAHFIPRSDAYMMLWYHAPYLKGIGYATVPNLANNSVIDSINNKIDSLITTDFVKWYPTYKVAIENCYDTTTGTSGDGIHPNNTGHLQIYNCAIAAINEANGGGGPTGKMYYSDAFHGIVEGVDDIFLTLRRGDTRYIQNQITTSQIADYKISGSGTADRFVTSGSILTGNLTSTDRQTNGIAAGVAAGGPVISMRNNFGGLNNKTFDWFIGSNGIEYRTLTDNLGTAIAYFRVVTSSGPSIDTMQALKLDVAGHLKVYQHTIASNSDSAIVWNRSNNAYEYAKINGASATTIYNGDGTLSGTRTISGAGNNINFGIGGSKLALFTINSSSRTVLNSGIAYVVDATNSDADYTVPANVIIAEVSDVLSTNRTLTLPTAATNGHSVTLVMRFSSGSNKYSLSSAVVDNATGSTFTTLDWGKTYDFMVDQGVSWRLIRKY